ncbi:hypothetical protein GQ42DRAFT_165178 [Ramicandelaber brevisporus]|nr:hypothetical protein GQ42DRAFT_165178 [Ramicandelaber brevisporus]
MSSASISDSYPQAADTAVDASVIAAASTNIAIPIREQSGLYWNNVDYTVKTGRGKKATTRQILTGVSGSLRPGELVGLMGSSGAGKTTQLNCLAGRISTGKLSGTVLMNGMKRNPHVFKKQIAYVEQDDLLYSTLTVRETIQYAAELRLPSSSFTREEKQARVENLIQTLRLDRVADSRIGKPEQRGISGGERKRTSVACELVTDPEVLFLDEATSGLDSNAAMLVVETARDIAHNKKKCVMMTIHQPSAKLFSMFDRVILMADGRIVYAGPVPQAADFFADNGYVCPAHENPADFYIDVLTLDNSTDEAREESRSRVHTLAEAFANSKYASGLHKAADADTTNNSSAEVVYDEKQPASSASAGQHQYQPLLKRRQHNSSWIHEFRTLLSRSWLSIIRDPSVTIGAIMQIVVLTIFLGITFYKLGTSQGSIQTRYGLLFFLPVNQSFGVIMPLLFIFALDRAIMIRERQSGTYRVSAFYLARVVVELPVRMLPSLIFDIIIFWMADLNHSDGGRQFGVFVGIFCAQLFVAISMGLMIASASKTVQTAQMITPLVIVTMMLFGGNLIGPNEMTPVWAWMRYISYFYYTFMALMQNEFTGLVFDCPQGGAQAIGCVPTGEAAILRFGQNGHSIGTCIGALVGIGMFFQILAYLMLRFRSKPRMIMI